MNWTAGFSAKQVSSIVRPAAHRVNLSDVAVSDAQPRPTFGGALHSACSALSDVGADGPLAGVAFNKMRRPGAQRTLKCWD